MKTIHLSCCGGPVAGFVYFVVFAGVEFDEVRVVQLHEIYSIKDKEHPRDRQGAIYKIKCADCQATYIGETARYLNTRLTRHKRAAKNPDRTNHIAKHR